MRICKVLFDIIVNGDTNGYLMDILNGSDDMEEIVIDICGIIKVDSDLTDMIDGSDTYGDNVVCFGEYGCVDIVDMVYFVDFNVETHTTRDAIHKYG